MPTDRKWTPEELNQILAEANQQDFGWENPEEGQARYKAPPALLQEFADWSGIGADSPLITAAIQSQAKYGGNAGRVDPATGRAVLAPEFVGPLTGVGWQDLEGKAQFRESPSRSFFQQMGGWDTIKGLGLVGGVAAGGAMLAPEVAAGGTAAELSTAGTLLDPILAGGAPAVTLPGAAAAGTAATAGGGVLTGTAAATAAANGLSANPALWTTQEKILAAGLGLTALTTVAQIAGGGDKTTSQTTTSSSTPPWMQAAGKKSWDDFIDDFYGVGTKSVKQRGEEDIAAQKGYEAALLAKLSGLDIGRLGDIRTAVKPYQEQLADVLRQSQTGTGYFTPTNIQFGGAPVASFVPRANRALAEQSLGMGKESSSINTNLADLLYGSGRAQAEREFQFNAAHPINEAANIYSQKLADLRKITNLGGQTTTSTGTVPGQPWYSALLQGANTALNFYDKIYNPRNNTGGLTLEQLKAALNSGG